MSIGNPRRILRKIETWEEIKELLRNNRHSLRYVNEYEGLDNFLGSGAYGKVFKIKGEDLTIKVTTDEDEINISSVIVKKRFTKCFLNIYSNQVLSHNLAIKIQDYLYPLDSKNLQIAKELGDLYESKILERTKVHSIHYLHEFDQLSKDSQAFLLDLRTDYINLGIDYIKFGHIDVNEKNFLQTKNGKMLLIDF